MMGDNYRNLPEEEKVFQEAGIRVTAVRLLVWRTVTGKLHGAFSLADLEDALPTVDRSTLFRTLRLLSDAHLLHDIDDGSGVQKYCVCHLCDTGACMGHVHLTCRRCGRTFCLTDVPVPKVALPDGFLLEEAEYVVKGLCAECGRSVNGII